ncbi:alpha/beta hydrolase [Sorangium sp. So ce1182]|uniref:alpha/beta hydrolase n=1 Tax=Sorangium sp. So ce1182 TaxID=3133334 RepID=UPI003F5ECA7A
MRAKLAYGAMVVLLAHGAMGCGDDAEPGGTETSSSSTGGTGGTGGDGGGSDGGGSDGGGSGGDGGAGDGGAGDGGAGGGEQIAWTPCPLFTDGAGEDAECAEIQVPLRWDQPDGKTIPFFVKRKLAATQPSRAQLWLLNGGPGYSGADFEPLVQALSGIDPTLDMYMPDHRGTGRSSRLGCPAGETPESDLGSYLSDAEVVACLPEIKAELGDDLAGYNVTNAARDVGEVIERTRVPSSDVLVLGGSYGTVWGHRYLQLYPDQPTAVMLTGVAVNAHLSDMDGWLNDLGQRYMAACGADPACSGNLGADPWATMTQTLDAFEEGACPEVAALGYSRSIFQTVFAQFLYQWAPRPLIPALIYRLSRCSPADVGAFAHLAGLLLAPLPEPLSPTLRFYSPVLRNNIMLSELWADPPPPASDVEAFLAQANVALGLTDDLAALHESWPRYTPDAHAGQWAATSVPLLLLHGELDFIPSAVPEALQRHFTGPNQTLVMLPRAPHVLESPTDLMGGSCDMDLMLQFLADPEAPLDTSCTEEVLPLDFSVPPDLSAAYLGTQDAWEGDPGAERRAPPASLAPSPEQARTVARIREALRVPGGRRALPRAFLP